MPFQINCFYKFQHNIKQITLVRTCPTRIVVNSVLQNWEQILERPILALKNKLLLCSQFTWMLFSSLIRLSITCLDAPERRRETNKVWFIDLGGSERVLKTKASGRRFDEGKAINLSLSALGDVIHALQKKNSHVPYR